MIKRAFAPPEERLRQPDRAREGDAGHAGRGAQEPRQSAAHLHGDRHRADRRQPRLLQDRRRRGLPRRHRQGAPRRVQAGQRRRHRRARRLQEMAAGRPAEALERRFRDRRRHVPQEARRRRDDRRCSLDELLAIAEKDLRKNQAAFAETARLIDPKRTPMQVLEKVAGRPSAGREAARDDAGRARRARPVHDRPPPHHDPEGRAGAWSRKRRRSCARRRARRWTFPGRSKPWRPRRTTT